MQESHSGKVALFEGKRIRKLLHDGEWWFSIIDIIEVLTDSNRPRKYWNDLKKKLAQEGYDKVFEKIGRLKMPAPDGKMRLTDCADTETMFRVIQSIPSPKVEPFKRWLARFGKERIDEIENPELSISTTRTSSGTRPWWPCTTTSRIGARTGWPCGSIFPPRPRIRTAPFSLGSWWIIRLPRPWKTVSSRRRSSSTSPIRPTRIHTPPRRPVIPSTNGGI